MSIVIEMNNIIIKPDNTCNNEIFDVKDVMLLFKTVIHYTKLLHFSISSKQYNY